AASPAVRARRFAPARGGALEEQLALASVSRERCSALELRPRFVDAPELCEEVGAHGGQEVVTRERPLRRQRVDELETRRRTERHRERDCAVQLHDWRRGELGKRVVERRDARPVRLFRRPRSRVTGGDRRLERVRAERAAEPLGTLERRETTTDEEGIPAGAVLIEE